MKNKANYRKTFGYRVRWFFYRLTWNDIKKVLIWIYEDLGALLALLALFLIIFILPHFFH